MSLGNFLEYKRIILHDFGFFLKSKWIIRCKFWVWSSKWHFYSSILHSWLFAGEDYFGWVHSVGWSWLCCAGCGRLVLGLEATTTRFHEGSRLACHGLPPLSSCCTTTTTTLLHNHHHNCFHSRAAADDRNHNCRSCHWQICIQVTTKHHNTTDGAHIVHTANLHTPQLQKLVVDSGCNNPHNCKQQNTNHTTTDGGQNCTSDHCIQKTWK